MPVYEYQCQCGAEFDRVLPVARYNEPQTCECGGIAEKIISSVPVVFASQDIFYTSPIDGRPITNRQARLEDLARNNCQPYDPEMKKDAERRRQEADAKLDRAVDETVEREIHAMTPRKRERLIGELEGGLTAEPMRHTANAKPLRVDLERGAA